MRVYYLQSENEPGKHQIAKVWFEKSLEPKPEDSSKTAINMPYSVLEVDEWYNGVLCKSLASNTRPNLPDKYYVGNDGKLYTHDGILVTVNLNPEKEAYKLSSLRGLTQAQLEAYIDTNITTLASAKVYLKKLSAVVLYLVKHTKLDQ
jgi:hypothetical protein